MSLLEFGADRHGLCQTCGERHECDVETHERAAIAAAIGLLGMFQAIHAARDDREKRFAAGERLCIDCGRPEAHTYGGLCIDCDEAELARAKAST